jgi:hypothetical protein
VHNPMIPHVVVLEPGLIVHKIYSGYWCSLDDRPWRNCVRTCARSPGNAGRIGTLRRLR